MDIEDIHDLVEEAEEIQPYLIAEAEQYAEKLNYFYHTEDNHCQLEDGYAVEKIELVNEAENLVNTVRSHEKMKEKLQKAAEELEDANDFRYRDGKKLDKDYLNKKINNLLDQYEQDFEEVLEISSRAHLDPDIPDPMSIRSSNRREDDEGKIMAEWL
ncbi:MAG: hypothetical protein ABEI78_01020 [Candidatus Nanohaloarchaea archaeon]